MRAFRLLILFICIFTIDSFAQVDSNKIFLKFKRTWNFPIVSGDKLGIGPANFLPKKSIFISSQSCPVYALFDGTVIEMKNIDSAYSVITQYADYFITYYGLEKPIVKEGDIIKRGQFLGTIAKDEEGIHSLEIHLYEKDNELETDLWFKHK